MGAWLQYFCAIHTIGRCWWRPFGANAGPQGIVVYNEVHSRMSCMSSPAVGTVAANGGGSEQSSETAVQ